VTAVAARAEGHPEREGLRRAGVVVSRAFADPGRWLPLAAAYRAPGGRVLAMLGREADRASLDGAAAAAGLQVVSLRAFRLPWSGADRAVASLRARDGGDAMSRETTAPR
jgi:16S rRNA (guanine527-N7)-methyltransferase